ncbi:hypothetical protein Daus18300_012473 [Diaporthe australafricana]|uniref:Uncharacterized protein n=1 Tax=Diaporthe australafricana TaxID=127596 RepID=A0ABR3W2N0_9PEZI
MVRGGKSDLLGCFHVTVSFTIGIGVPLYLLLSSVIGLREWGIDITMRGIWQRGLQTADPYTLAFDSGNVTYSLPACVLLSNMFQILVSFLYIFYNNILTRQLVADEWKRFLEPSGKKPLRVSQPVGMQRSSYMLSLPFNYSVPLMVSMMVLHWLVSQSVFLEQTMGFDTSPNPARVPSFDRTAVGYSQLGQVLAIVFGGFLVIALLNNSALRQYVGAPPGFVKAGMSSALIRAFCQRPEEDYDASYFPVRLGAVESKGRKGVQSGPQTLTFSTYINIAPPVNTKNYMLPVHKSQVF